MLNDWIAPRVRDIPPSGIRAFFELSAGSQDIISLGVGEPDFVTPKHIREACMQALSQGATSYTPNAGLLELREGISGYLHSNFNLRYDPANEVLVTVGSSEALDLALRAFTAPGDEILIPSPSYIAYSPIGYLNGGTVVEVEARAEDGFKLTAEDLQRVITPRSKLLMLNYPNNPTGAIMTAEDWQPIADIVKENNLLVISDEVYAELTYDRKHVSIASLPEMQDRTIVLSGFSKAFAMTGWRIGYACGHRELLAAMLKIHQYTAMCAPVLGQIAAIESLCHGLEAMNEMIEVYRQRRELVVNGFRSIGMPCHVPEGAFYAFPSIAHTGLDSETFALQLLKESSVAVVPGHVFGAGGEGHIRCSYSVSTQKLSQALERMESFMKVKI